MQHQEQVQLVGQQVQDQQQVVVVVQVQELVQVVLYQYWCHCCHLPLDQVPLSEWGETRQAVKSR